MSLREKINELMDFTPSCDGPLPGMTRGGDYLLKSDVLRVTDSERAVLQARLDMQEAEIKKLCRFETAFNEWIERSEWVQEDTTGLFHGMLGKHRADAMRIAIEQLQAQLDAAYLELYNQRRTIKAVYDREVWDRADAHVALSRKESKT